MNVSPGFDLDSLTTCVVLIDEHGIVDTLNQCCLKHHRFVQWSLLVPQGMRLYIGMKH